MMSLALIHCCAYISH